MRSIIFFAALATIAATLITRKTRRNGNGNWSEPNGDEHMRQAENAGAMPHVSELFNEYIPSRKNGRHIPLVR
ncbi:MAG: hypothetical protein Q7S28_03790 [bacterium]|nr:hypothetical protein [bacterium]